MKRKKQGIKSPCVNTLADIVAFLYRDDYYDKESEKKDIIEIIIAKQRNGPVGTVELAFMKAYNKFVNLERKHAEQQPPPAEKPKQNNFQGNRWHKKSKGDE